MVTNYQPGPTPVAVGSPTVPTAAVQAQTGQKVRPFRLATLERSDTVLQYNAVPLTTAEQQQERTIPGTGFTYGYDLIAQAVAPSNNSANVAYQEDGPYSIFSSIIYKDVNGELINCDGWSLYQLTRYLGLNPFNMESSADTNIYQKVTSTGATGGNFTVHIPVPVASDRRTLQGLLGNQDRNQSYSLRTNLAPSTSVYSTGPSVQPNITTTVQYESYAVPNASDDMGVNNQVIPPTYGLINYATRTISASSPQGGSQITHQIFRLGYTTKVLMLVMRSNGSRATAESNLPSNIQLKIGNQTIFNESVAYRRALMYKRYGFDAPSGVLVYDYVHDFAPLAGGAIGTDYINTQNVNLFTFLITYPSGFGSTNNTLTFVVGDCVVPNGMNIYG